MNHNECRLPPDMMMHIVLFLLSTCETKQEVDDTNIENVIDIVELGSASA
jgi:hypothetical protein